MQVDVSTIRSLKAQLAQINSVPLAELEIYDSGKQVILSADALRDCGKFRMTNVDIICDIVCDEHWIRRTSDATPLSLPEAVS